MRVRRARREDFGEVTRLYLTQNPGRRGEGPMRRLRASARTRVLVAEDGGRIVGFVWAHIIDYANTRIAYIEELFVEEGHRRQGVASALVSDVLRWFADAKVPMAFVSSSAGDRRAHSFYRSMGFQRARGPWFYLVPTAHRSGGR